MTGDITMKKLLLVLVAIIGLGISAIVGLGISATAGMKTDSIPGVITKKSFVERKNGRMIMRFEFENTNYERVSVEAHRTYDGKVIDKLYYHDGFVLAPCWYDGDASSPRWIIDIEAIDDQDIRKYGLKIEAVSDAKAFGKKGRLTVYL
jgi:hypothetical protein